MKQIAIINVIIVCLGILIRILHRAYLTPLRKIPGPWYARLTHLVLKYHVVTGHRMQYIHSLHLAYGPIVLVAPTEVMCSSNSSFRTIHRVSKPFRKSPWYQLFVTKPANVFSMIDPKLHAFRRRLLAHSFSKSYLRTNWESHVRTKADMAIGKIKRDALEGEVDILKFFMFMATDAVGHLCFGESFKTLENERKTQYIEDIQQISKFGGLQAEFPTVFAVLKSLHIPLRGLSQNRMLQYASIAVQNAKSESNTNPSIFRKVLAKSKTDNAEGLLTDLDVTQEATGMIVAGTDTTATTLTFLIYNILKDPHLQKRLEEEVDGLNEDFESKDVEELKLLNAVIDEGLRLYGAAPGALPRIVPKEGAHLDGYFVPGDITVCTQAYTIHRDPEIFPEPESFQPERWLASKTDHLKAVSHPFGAGTRTCLGIHLARTEMWLALALFFRQCKGARIAASQSEDGMEMKNFFSISPKGKKCMITLREGY
ncbi:hypothetical protein SBOR_4701 [Sclerotinia borealis F-4128]|uniref:Cytochrome P450 n=1 Tax=Sclerotinia borealis (strain F-4128) TaxID=1432307 RepID=W9CJT0_SCLBF|nr:hypothetical protein SBOR_4701 [Sclerotinia borealis F-4128]